MALIAENQDYTLPVFGDILRELKILTEKQRSINPKIFSFYADNIESSSAHTFQIIKKDSCTSRITVTTSIGTFEVPSWINSQSLSEFAKPYKIISVTIEDGDCVLTDILIIGNKLR